jgi:putative transposase
VRYACIARYRGEFPLRLMCRCLAVSPSGFYATQHRPPSARARANARLRLEIRAVHRASHRRYGAPKVHAELQAQGVRCGRHRVARLMRADGLRATRARRFRVTTQSAHRHPIAANALARRFAVSAYRERDRAWAADITYLATGEGWLYLAVILDLASRRVVGWCVDRRLDQSLSLRALEQALRLRRPAGGVLHHSDQGVQYACDAYQRLLAHHGLQVSMSRVGDCWDNAVVESFFATLKTELKTELGEAPWWPTRAAAVEQLRAYIDIWYNHQRRHASLGYRSPVQYERDLARCAFS